MNKIYTNSNNTVHQIHVIMLTEIISYPSYHYNSSLPSSSFPLEFCIIVKILLVYVGCKDLCNSINDSSV